MASLNLASKFSSKVDERFTRESFAQLVLGNKYEFNGVETVNVYSIPTVAMTDYNRNGGNTRYGVANNLTRNVQTMKVSKDRAFTFTIDKGDKIQSQMVMDAGRALSRQTSEVIIPEFDTYAFHKLAEAAQEVGNVGTTAATKSNAYELFLAGNEKLSDNNVPETGRIALCSYNFANLLKQDPAFSKQAESSQKMVHTGIIGEIDGVKIVKVPSSRLPAGCAFLLTHPSAAVGPKQLNTYRIHQDPPGISGWLVEGREIYDVFVLNEKKKAVYYHGSQAVLRTMMIQTSATDVGKSTILLASPTTKAAATNKWMYQTAATAAALAAVKHGTAITADAWTAMAEPTVEITPTSGHKFVRVVEVDSSNKPVGYGDAILNIG